MGWVVTGIEPFAFDAAVARESGIQVLNMPVEQALDHLESEFDAVVLGDVLEHVADPWTQLSRVRSVCRPDAQIIISVPNVAHVFVRMQVLIGRFNYQDRGILDRTHLRFFTRRTALALVASAGLRCQAVTCSPTPLEILMPKLLDTGWGRVLLDANARLARAFPTLLGYQVIMACSLVPGCDAIIEEP